MTIVLKGFSGDKGMIEMLEDACTKAGDSVMKELNNDRGYLRAGREYAAFRKKIECLLPDDEVPLLEDLYISQEKQNSMYSEAIFIKGIEMGIALSNYYNIAEKSDMAAFLKERMIKP